MIQEQLAHTRSRIEGLICFDSTPPTRQVSSWYMSVFLLWPVLAILVIFAARVAPALSEAAVAVDSGAVDV